MRKTNTSAIYMDSRIASTSSGSSDGAAASRGGGASRSRSSTLMNQDVGAANNSAHPPIKCPRCDSLNTKFCYYNNYSQTQPRHFCKSCRRYWTEGGALRNVPVGGGCRKNKRVKQRPLINLGAAGGLLDPSSLIDETTSNMLARLSNTSSPFPNLINSGVSSFGTDDTSTQLLNIAFSRFQESMRLRQQQQPSDQSPETAPYFDMSFPALVHKHNSTSSSCTCGACGNRAHNSIHHGACGGLMNSFEGANLGFTSLPMKMEHDVGMAGFCSSGYDSNPIYHDQSVGMHMGGTSATATLASIEDQLSSFSNLQHVDTFNTDASATLLEDKSRMPIESSTRSMVSGPLQLLGHVEKGADNMVESSFANDTKERLVHINMLDEKSLLSSTNINELSLNMMQPMSDSNWQATPLMMTEMMFEPHHGMWSSHATRPWQDNMHSLAATSAATGSVL